MNTTIRNTALASILFAAASGAAFAAETADLSVKGVIKPAACNVTFAGGAIVDFGTIVASTLSATAPTILPSKETSFTISCDAATKVGWNTVDGRAGTANTAAGQAIFNNSTAWFGVGSVSGKNIGTYTIDMRGTSQTQTADGTNVDRINSHDSGATWANNASLATTNDAARVMSWAPTGTLIPGSYKNITQPLKITLGIGRTSELPALTQEIPIDGVATLMVKYL
ncbi:DUF1120 domain-containing protein [Cupriavidus plantarum]|uniref:DUF1120 domain-containing protein n=2 Tax=Cupriavidus plantarum TaxID=942865 RepID=UPI000EABACA8|nr:DUF1120 domain-containing protein [Cupriavidus plantarum]RLK45916.1 type 1 fimbria pilin [Cupriavidus plantarum]CAG2127730.1 hypothetical protein LMG26296_00772 [Cupriavidus plantarum]SMR67092.1 Pilin (type 1 fimbria component protein) [Cupriavidus plantarum]